MNNPVIKKISDCVAVGKENRVPAEWVRQALDGGAKSLGDPGKLIKAVTDGKSTASRIKRVSYATPSGRALYALLKQYDASRPECGTDAILIEQKIKDCAAIPGSLRNTEIKYAKGKITEVIPWVLVARRRESSTGKFYEIWKDVKSGKLWADCSEKAFGLPTAEEYEQAKRDGIQKALGSRSGGRSARCVGR